MFVFFHLSFLLFIEKTKELIFILILKRFSRLLSYIKEESVKILIVSGIKFVVALYKIVWLLI